MVVMKLLVFDRAPVGWRNQPQDGALAGHRGAPEGRPRRSPALFNYVLALVGLVFAVDFFTALDLSPPLQYPAYGALFGGVIGREVIVRRERRDGELPPETVKRLERVGVLGGIAVMMLALLAQVALNVLKAL
jgi:hypothetical protein